MSGWQLAEEELRKLARKQRLRLLVWGPGDPGPHPSRREERRYRKRLQIRTVLQSVFTESEVNFSEDPVMQRLTTHVGGQLRAEAIHAKLAHVVLMLAIGRGVELELDYFVPTYSWFRDKVFVFLPDRYMRTTGLVSDVLRFLRRDHVIGFSSSDFLSCRIATEMSVEVVDAVAIARLLEL